MVAVYALRYFLGSRDRLDELRYDGLVPDEVLDSDEWTSVSPRLPSMRGLYEIAREEWDRAQAEAGAG